MPAVDRNVLRIGVYELLWADGVPDGVAISEAVALAEDLSTDASPSFVNGVLARIKAEKPTTALDRDPSVDAQPSLDPPRTKTRRMRRTRTPRRLPRRVVLEPGPESHPLTPSPRSSDPVKLSPPPPQARPVVPTK